MPTTFHDSEGCRTFPSYILISHRYAAAAAISDADDYGARSLAEGRGTDYSTIDNQVEHVHPIGMLAFHPHSIISMYGESPYIRAFR